MKKTSKIWLWAALVICICTTVMNALEGRWPSVAIAVISIIGLCILLFKEKKLGFYVMCICAAVTFLVSTVHSIQGGTSVVLYIVMSLVGAAIVPLITGLFIKSQWKELK